jgi:protein-S-isoprenylcysteine O-methyltransferase Ste14
MVDLYSRKDHSIPQKVTILIFELFIIGLSYWILFSGGYHKLFPKSSTIDGDEIRHLILFVFHLIVFLRICITIFYLIKRHIPWEETFSIAFAFAIYYVGFSILGYKTPLSIDFIDILAFVLFLMGSYLNTGAELARDRWKKKSENRGRLYTRGLFKYSMHINYFGDLLWVVAYAIITRNWYSFLIPVMLFFFFVFFNIPKLDNYLAAKYGKQFDDYRSKTKKLIPFIY